MQGADLRGKMPGMLKPTLPVVSELSVASLGLGAPLRPRSPRRSLRTSLRAAGGLLTLGWLAACGGVSEFDLTEGLGDVKIVGSPVSGTLTTMLPTPVSFGLDVKQQAVMRGANGPVSAVYITGMVFQTTMGGSPDGSTVPFDFVKSVQVYLESKRANSSLPRELLATQATPPGRITGFSLAPNNMVNLLPLILEGSQLTSVATGTLPTQDVLFTGSVTVHVSTL